MLLCYNLIKNYKGCVILLSISEREFFIEWIALMESYSFEERTFLTGLSDIDLEKKYKLALIKVADEIYQSN